MKNPLLDLLKYRAFPEVAASLRARTEKILHRFQQVVCQVLPMAEELTLAQLRNSLPLILGQIAEALEADQPAATHELLDISQPHGEIRFHQRYNINELLVEYHVLRRIMIEEVADQMGRSLDPTEAVALNLGIDTALRRGVVTFSEFQTNELTSANELQSRYLSFLSHDLRGGLNGALLMIEVLKRELASEPRFSSSLEDLDVMRRSILDTVATMDRFLSAERLRRGKVQVTPAAVDLHAVVADLATQGVYTARDKGIELEADVPAGASLVSDRELIVLILQNLLNNAIKYTRRGRVRIEGRPGRAPRADGTPAGEEGGYTISILDQGPGIAPDRLGEIFKPFTRGDTHGQKGVGLGLTIARQASDLLGAKILVESKVGAGSTFHVEFPATPPAPTPQAEA